MDRLHVIRLPAAEDTSERCLGDILAAIELVAAGGARRVMLTGLPDAGLVAGEALARAQCAGVRFSLSPHHGGGPPTVVVGPIEA